MLESGPAASVIRTWEWPFTMQFQLYILESDFSHNSFRYTYWRVTLYCSFSYAFRRATFTLQFQLYVLGRMTFYTAALVLPTGKWPSTMQLQVYILENNLYTAASVIYTGEWTFTLQLLLYILESEPLHYSFCYTYWRASLYTAAAVIRTGERAITPQLQLYILENDTLLCNFSCTYWKLTFHTSLLPNESELHYCSCCYTY